MALQCFGICSSNWTSWIVLHCFTGTSFNTSPPTLYIFFTLGPFSLNPHCISCSFVLHPAFLKTCKLQIYGVVCSLWPAIIRVDQPKSSYDSWMDGEVCALKGGRFNLVRQWTNLANHSGRTLTSIKVPGC